MLASFDEGEGAVQETSIRAWRSLEKWVACRTFRDGQVLAIDGNDEILLD
jgi:hypothetical protein